MNARNVVVAVVSCVGVISCRPAKQEFQPTENVKGRTVEGFKEAFYDLASGGKKVGEVTVWSRGASREKRDGHEQTLIQIGFTIENTGDVPITFDTSSVRLESVQAKAKDKDRILRDVESLGSPRKITASPQSITDVELAFALPPGIMPDEVKAFRVKWRTDADSESYTEFTPFVQHRERFAYVPVYGYYNPYYPFDYPYYSPFDYPFTRIVIVRQYPRRVIIRGRHVGR